jgi:Protein of unknown function (DUF2778)
MFHCGFKLNDQPMSALKFAGLSVPAFSGLGSHVNKRAMACAKDLGPIPPGRFYIVDRPTGGRMGAIRNWWRGHWFALYAADGRVNDETWCDGVMRGNFRLHPKGPRGISQGCVTLENACDFSHISAMLQSVRPTVVAGVVGAYGVLTVS